MANTNTNGIALQSTISLCRNEVEVLSMLFAAIDETAPVPIIVTAGGAIEPDDTLEVTVTEETGIYGVVLIIAEYADREEIVWNGTPISMGNNGPGYSVIWSPTWTAIITHTGDGWPEDFTLRVVANDTSGNSASTTQAFTCEGVPDEVLDTTPPEVTLVSPTAGASITTVTPLVVDVTDDVLLAQVIVAVTDATSGVTEIAHDGVAFRGLYSALSSRSAIAGGFRYTILRYGGWRGSPTVEVYPVDTSGQVA